MTILVCGGFGFIGSAFIRNYIKKNLQDKIINLDSLTIGSNKENLKEVEKNENNKGRKEQSEGRRSGKERECGKRNAMEEDRCDHRTLINKNNGKRKRNEEGEIDGGQRPEEWETPAEENGKWVEIMGMRNGQVGKNKKGWEKSASTKM